MSMRLQSANEFTTTAPVIPTQIWKMDCLYLRHQASQTEAWSSPSARRCPVIGSAPGISGIPFIRGMSVAVQNYIVRY